MSAYCFFYDITNAHFFRIQYTCTCTTHSSDPRMNKDTNNFHISGFFAKLSPPCAESSGQCFVFYEISSSWEKSIAPWWRHQMETSAALLALCARNSPVTGEFHSQRPVTRSFDVFFDLRLNKLLSKQSRCRWFETPSSCSLWRQCNDTSALHLGHLDNLHMGQVTILRLSCYLVLLSVDSKTR